MRHTGLYIFLLSISFQTIGQIRSSTFIVKKGTSFELSTSDIIVADSLIMEDSSRLILNKQKSENYIRAKVAVFGNNVRIDGKGIGGLTGNKGTAGKTPMGPCYIGYSGNAGARGTNGAAGVNLYLYLEQIIVNGDIVVDLSGGNGGDGGDGGEGGGGSPGTIHCAGGDGGKGGNGGPGGDGGKGGVLTFGGNNSNTIKPMIGSQVVVNALGGNFGYGGIGGKGGSPGLGPSKKQNGFSGKAGRDGEKGKSGANGSIQFQEQPEALNANNNKG
jgi:hypothetical protein